MSGVFQCLKCGKKLKLQQPTPGKKLRCPNCKEPFVLRSAGDAQAKPAARKKKRRAAPVEDDLGDLDDFSDDFAEEEFDDDDQDAGAPRSASRGKKKGAGKKGKAASGGKSNKIVVIVAGVLSFVAAFVVAFMLVSGSGDNAAEVAPVPVNENANAVEDDAAEAVEVAADPEPDGDDEEKADAQAVSENDPGPVVHGHLPPNTEMVISIDVAALGTGPLGQLLQNPMLAESVQQFRDQSGFDLAGVESVTIGIAGVSAAAELGPQADLNVLPAVIVAKLKEGVDAAKQITAIPGKSVTLDDPGLTYVRVQPDQPGAPPLAVWSPESGYIVANPESSIDGILAQSKETKLNADFFSGTGDIRISLIPTDPDKVFRDQPVPSELAGGAVVSMPESLSVIRPLLSGFNTGITLQNDIELTGRLFAGSQEDAATISAELQKVVDEARTAASQTAGLPPVLQQLVTGVLESAQVSTDGNGAKFSFKAPGAGQQLAAFAPMFIGPAIVQAQEAARRAQARDNLKNISDAMRNFHEIYGRFPNAASRGPDDQKLLSWRVHLLPFLGYEDLYNLFALNEPWDSPHNQALVSLMPDIYSPQGVALEPGKTIYQVPIGELTVFRGARGMAIQDIIDGPVNTVLVLEVSAERAITWTQPDDYDVVPENPTDGLISADAVGFRAALADGKIRVIESSMDAETLKALFTSNGGEIIQPWSN